MYSAITERTAEFHEIYTRYFGKPNPIRVDDYSVHSDEKDAFAWNGNVDALPVNDRVMKLILNGEDTGRRSNAIMSVVNALVKERIKRSDIFHIFECYPIGEKWRRQHKGNTVWLDKHIDKARRRCGTQSAKSKGDKESTNSQVKSFPLTDSGAAERLVAMHGESIRSSSGIGGWFLYNDSRGIWEPNESGIYVLAKQTARSILKSAAEIQDDATRNTLAKYALSLESRSKLEAMIFLAARDPSISCKPDEFDADPGLFNCPNGTINLKTMNFYPHRRSDLITKTARASCDSKASYPLWEATLDRIFNSNTNLISFFQRAVGYSMTGDVREQCLFFLYGLGANGKSTVLETLRAVFGDYAKQTDFSTFLEKKNDGARNDLAALRGSRFVSGAEVESGKKLAEVLVKQITGGDTISARFLHHEFFEFRPTFKLWLAANHKPVVKGTDHAIWRRIKLIPFTVTIPEDERDPDLVNKLKAELPGILNWALEGCMEWQEKGLGVPDEVKEATAAYREEMDVLGGFISDHCTIDPELMVKSKDLYDKYQEWCQANDEEPISKRTFGLKLKERGLKDGKVGPCRDRGWCGIGFRTQLPEGRNRTQVSVFPIRENNFTEITPILRPDASGDIDASAGIIPQVTCSSCGNFRWNPHDNSEPGHCLGTPPDGEWGRIPNKPVDCPQFREREAVYQN